MKTPIPHPDSFQQTGKQPIILFALSLIFALSMLLPTKSLAQEKEAYVVVNGTKMTYYYKENKPTNALPIENYNEWPEGLRKTITTAEIDQSLENYTTLNSCAYWFYNFENLTEITNLKYLHTDEVADMSNMFACCYKLKSLDLSNFNTANVKNMYWMFCRCDDLESIKIGDGWNTGNVINMGGLFNGCHKLQNFDLHRLNTSKVEDMSYMLNSWTETTVFDLSEFDTRNVKNMQGMFAGCRNLEKIIFNPELFKTDNVEDMSGMFSSCYKFYDIDFISSLNTSKVTSMQGMFYECDGFTILDLHTFDTHNVTNMRVMFQDCSNLQVVNLSSFNTQSVTDMRGMFDNCKYLTTIIVSDNWDLSNLLNHFDDDHASDNHLHIFSRCENLIGNDGIKYTDPSLDQFTANENYDNYHQDINYANANDGYLTKDSYKIFYKSTDDNMENYLEYTPSSFNGDQNITINNPSPREGYDFYWTRVSASGEQIGGSSTSLTISAGDIGNRIYVMNWVVPYVETSENPDGSKTLTFKYGVKPDGAFNLNKDNNSPPEWYSLSNEITKVVFDESFIDARPTSCANWFSGFSNLKEIIDMEKYLNTSLVEDMQNMFFLCQNLTNINLTNFNTEAVKNMYNMFGLCDKLSVLDLRNFNTKNVTNMNMMFCTCNSLTTILVSEGWSIESIDNTIDQYIFGPTPNIIGNAGTTFNKEIMNDYNAHISYAHIDEGASNPGYLTTESYKIFYDLDGGTWADGVNPPTSFALDLNDNIQIPTPKKSGMKFVGWTGTFASGLSSETPTKNVQITPDKLGNRIYTAHWEEKDINITIPDKITFPASPLNNEAVCEGSEKSVTLSLALPDDEVVAKYVLSIPNVLDNDIEVTPSADDSELEIVIDIPQDQAPGAYQGSLNLYFLQNATPKEYHFTVEIAVARNVLLHLYKDVIFIDNSSGLFGKNGTYQWYHNDQEIPNATNQYLYDPNMSGVYKAKMYTTDGLEVYSCPIDEGKGLSKNSKLQVKTYPNPVVAGNEFTLEVAEYDPSANYTIHISNSNGVVVKEIANAAQFNTLILNRGIYSGSITSGGRKQGFKLIVK